MSTVIWKHPIVENFVATALEFFRQHDPLGWHQNHRWALMGDRFLALHFDYPAYYQQNFHSIQGGYLNPEAALSYDFVSQCLLLPHEKFVRSQMIQAVQGKPCRILDLGCGTGSSTLLLKQSFPEAEVTGLDLSPYMLTIAEEKAQQNGVQIRFLQGNAEQTEWSAASFDLITASLLFHETPRSITQVILQEAYRLLAPGGEIVVLDGDQQKVCDTHWIHFLFEEPYLKQYGAGRMEDWMQAAGFRGGRSHPSGWFHQVSHGVKPPFV